MHIKHTDFESTYVKKYESVHFSWNTVHSLSTFRFLDNSMVNIQPSFTSNATVYLTPVICSATFRNAKI